MLTFPCTHFAHKQVATSLSALIELFCLRGLDLNKYAACAASATYQCAVSLPKWPMRQAVHSTWSRLLPTSSKPHCDQRPTECVWPPPAISVWSHNEGHGDCIASIIHTQRQARLKHVKQYKQYESCIKHLSVLRHDVYACVTAHRCACTQKVSHSFPPHGTAVNPLRTTPPPPFTVLILQLMRGENSVYFAQNTLVNEQDPCWVKHLVRLPNTSCDGMNVSLGQEVEGGSRKDFMKSEILF